MCEDEKSLLEKAKNGDVFAYESLIEGYQKKVFNLALRMVGNREDASELAQEVFIRVYKSLKGFKEQSQFSTWIYKITTNVCLDELRKRKNRNITSLDEEIKLEDSEIKRQIEDDKPTPEMIVEKNELKKVVSDAIKLLSDEHRTVIVMRDIQGFSYEEIARIINCPEGTVKSRLNRARLALKEILKGKAELLSYEFVK
ncbi:MAG: sigma-70 family RNA polymerase sigma factor [Clostridiales bacterium]|jgi:RNA polymerase sigma-70 factor (ECF subfamily)|nr:sigma-70 family RNA polymerase sigma factor [Eubacteriales bacterium]MDH7565300.1 sigma-70 family RNA polymerase sigma factor [Clostridiales bacterium]